MGSRLAVACGLVGIAVAAWLVAIPTATSQGTGNACWRPAAAIALTGPTCGPVQPLQLSCHLPPDIVPATDLNVRQRSADVFSWQEFIALNWPAVAGRAGQPDPSRSMAGQGTRVWETWKEEFEVFRPNGAPPEPWNAPRAIPAPCGEATKGLFRVQKIDDVLDESIQAAGSSGALPATLTDQRGRLVRYEIRMNQVMFDYIVDRRLYDARVQAGARTIAFPPGSILVKAAWREVTPAEEASHHTVSACACDRDANRQPVNCQPRRMGLVGLHITQKTASSPQWIWSTFEHVNNVPGPGAGAHPALYDPRCPTCPRNRQTPAGVPSQITRVTPIPATAPNCARPGLAVDDVQRLNTDVRRALGTAGTVFRFYQLVGTQVPVPPTGNGPPTVFTVRPSTLANTTMESFVQGTSSCMGCHATARTVDPMTFVSSDFTFALNNAQPHVPNPNVIPPPDRPITSWDVENWAAITRGYELATQTYERLPGNVPQAKLHCSSCHLNGGGNQTAAWWVNLRRRYPTPPALQQRINGCFERSLNGRALCTPQGHPTPGNPPPCDTHAEMHALTTYMDWLTAQWNRPEATTHGFPPIPTLTGNVANGRLIFQQKCAVCHGSDGRGRYANDTYYRPALWGRHSFNQAAGMFSHPQELAAFVRWNMPLGAGGSLTDQEAWDVEAYLHSQPRPVTPASTSN
jgi:cytochrome c